MLKKFFILLFLCWRTSHAWAETEITAIKVEGNQIVETDAVLTMIQSKVGQELDEDVVSQDILMLYDLKYFSEIEVFKQEADEGWELIFQLKEKPAIVEIDFEGFESVKSDDFKEKLETKIYTIVDQATIERDLIVIEREYRSKGYYLANISYELVPVEGDGAAHNVRLVYRSQESDLLQVTQVYINGNQRFTDGELIELLAMRPITRSSSFGGTGGAFQDEFLERDRDFLQYFYMNQGFLDVVVDKPIISMSVDRRYVTIQYNLTENDQYYMAGFDMEGDVLFSKEEMEEEFALKEGELFRYGSFQRDIQKLVEKYADQGYAFADPQPLREKTEIEKDGKKVPAFRLTYKIDKGPKVFFGLFTITGNTKTRDNVIRRELQVAEGELYSGSLLTESKSNIERLGFFEEVKFVRKRNPDQPNLLNYEIQVKEKPTGTVNAAIGYSPTQVASQSRVTGQFSYGEQNQFGYGWSSRFSGRWNGGENYSFELGFRNPSVNDGPWSLGFSGVYKNDISALTDEISIAQRSAGGNVTVGRDLFEKVRGSVTYSLMDVQTDSDSLIIDNLKNDGLKSGMIFSLSRNTTNSYLDPTDGMAIDLSQRVYGGLLGGDTSYTESNGTFEYYYPVDFGSVEEQNLFRTYFHLNLDLGMLFPYAEDQIPVLERYRLGGPHDIRGFPNNSLGPSTYLLQDPESGLSRFVIGGNKQIFFQWEYFFPLIQEAGLKALFFVDGGRVFDSDENFSLKDYDYSYGFGFRWLTPVAPFRFEWAYPYKSDKSQEPQFILAIGF